MKVVGTSIREDQVEQIDQIAADFQANRSMVIRWAIDAYLADFSLPKCPPNRTNASSVGHKTAIGPLPRGIKAASRRDGSSAD